MTAESMNLSNFIFEEQSFIDSKRTPALKCVCRGVTGV